MADDGTTTTTNLFGLDLVLQQGDDGRSLTARAPLYLLTDGLGSVRVEMMGGNATATTSYGPYGSIHQQTGTSQTSYGYTGEQFHAGTGLLYLRARYYNPNLHQFMGRDPWSGNSRNPRTLNLYVYAYGNPLLYTDPTGRCGQLPDGTPLCPTGGTVSSNSALQEGFGVLSNTAANSAARAGYLGWWDIFVYKRVGYTAVFLEKLSTLHVHRI